MRTTGLFVSQNGFLELISNSLTCNRAFDYKIKMSKIELKLKKPVLHANSVNFFKKVFSFQFLSISEEICGIYIINGTSKCKTFVEKCCKQQSLSGLYLRRKTKYFPVSLHFRRNLWCRHHQWNI